MENNHLIVSEVEASLSSASDALGISPERADELERLIMHEFIDQPRYTAIIAILSKRCKHANELAYIAMSVGRLSILKEGKSSRFSISDLLS